MGIVFPSIRVSWERSGVVTAEFVAGMVVIVGLRRMLGRCLVADVVS